MQVIFVFCFEREKMEGVVIDFHGYTSITFKLGFIPHLCHLFDLFIR